MAPILPRNPPESGMVKKPFQNLPPPTIPDVLNGERLRSLVDPHERREHVHPAGEDAVGQQEGVEKVDAEEAEVGQSFQQAFQGRVADLAKRERKKKR